MALTASFDPTFPKANGQVSRCKVYKGVLYICGTFTQVNGVARNSFAAIDPQTNAVLPLALTPGVDPGTDVTDFVILNDVIYIVGNTFSSPRNSAAAYDLSGALLPWNPDLGVSQSGLAIATDGAQIFVAGGFLSVNGGAVPRNYLAAFDPVTGAATPWDPHADGGCTGLLVAGSTVYVVGSFVNINTSVPRNRACAVDNATGAVLPFDPNVDSSPINIELYNGNVYLAGFFSSVNGGAYSRPGLASFNAVTGAANAGFDAHVPGIGWSVHQFNGRLFFCGSYTYLGQQKNFAILDPATGARDPLQLNFDTLTRDVTVLGSKTFVVGNFGTYLGTTRRNNIAAYALGSSVLKSMNAGTNGVVRKVSHSGDRLYAAGNFTTATGPNGSFPRAGLAAFDAITGDVLPFAPDPGIDVTALLVFGTDVYFCGVFDTVLGQPREKAAAVDQDGNLLPWDPNLGVGATRGFDLITDGADIYIAGKFTTVNGGVARNNLFKVDATTGTADPTWDPNADDQVNTLSFDGTWLYLGGTFANVGGQPRVCLARVSPIGAGTVGAGWIFNAYPVVYAITQTSGSDLYVNGGFASVNGTPQPGLAKISAGALVPAWANALSPDAVPGFAIQAFLGGLLFVGSSASHLGGEYRPGGTSASSAGVLGGFAPRIFQTLGIYDFDFDFVKQTLFVGGDFEFVGVSEAGFMAAFAIPAPPTPGLPQSPRIKFLNRRPQSGAPALTMLRWDPVVRADDNSPVTVDMYRVYRTASKNLEDPVLVAEISTRDIKGDVDTLFVEEIDGYFRYCVSAVNETGEGGKSCANLASTEQLERLGG